MLADTLAESLRAVPRQSILAEVTAPVMDEDAAVTFSDRFPLERLVDAATSPILPDRLRVRIAIAAFTRAVVPQRGDAGSRVAPVLGDLAPLLKVDLDRYVAAASEAQRQEAGVLVLFAAPGMRPTTVRGIEEADSAPAAEPRTRYDVRPNWWCDSRGGLAANEIGGARSELPGLLYVDRRVPYPAFITAAERAATEQERLAFNAAARSGRSYLGAAVLQWVRTNPLDPRAADALMNTVRGWRFGCGDDDRWSIARDAFTLLHRRHPQSRAAQQTKYLYR